MLKTRIPQLCQPCQDGPRKQRTNAQNLLNHQSQHQTQGFGWKVSQQELQWCFSQWFEMVHLPWWLGTLLLRNLGGQGKYPISPAWTSHEIYFCVANKGTNPPATNKTSARICTASTEADLSCRTEASWKGQCGAGKDCVSERAGCWGGGSSSGLRRQNSVVERQPHRPVCHSHHSPREAHRPLAVS